MRNRLEDMLGFTGREPKNYEVDRMERDILNNPKMKTVAIQEVKDAFNSGVEVWNPRSLCDMQTEKC